MYKIGRHSGILKQEPFLYAFASQLDESGEKAWFNVSWTETPRTHGNVIPLISYDIWKT